MLLLQNIIYWGKYSINDEIKPLGKKLEKPLRKTGKTSQKLREVMTFCLMTQAGRKRGVYF